MKSIVLVIALLFVVACGKEAPQAEYDMAAAPIESMPEGGAAQRLTRAGEPARESNVKAKKYIALKHHLTIETAAEKMQANFDAAVQHCEALNCQLLNAQYNRATRYSPPAASLSVRVPPRSVSVFLSGLAEHGEVLSHGRNSEDKTGQVVDADARIKNLTSLRDRLRAMLSDKTAKFKDIIQVERALADAQSQLDSIVSYRKILALETDWVAVDINFTAMQGITEQGFFSPVARALKDAGRVMMESFAMVITFLVGAIPWLLIGVPVLLIIRRCWAKIKAK